MTDKTVDTSQSSTPRDRSWIVLAISIAFVVGVVALFSYAMRDSFSNVPAKAYDVQFTDNFDRRANETGLGSPRPGLQWASVSGLWALDASRATIAFPDAEVSIAVIGNVTNPVVQAQVSGMQRCGVVTRYVDPKNYLELVRVPGFGVWNLVEVRDGEEKVLGKLADVKDTTVAVQLAAGRRIVNAEVAGRTISVVAPSDVRVGAVGFSGHTKEAAGCVFGDLWAFSGR
jgi:hypothetical protein